MKPLSTVLSSAVNKAQQHQEKNYRERRESNPGLLGEKQVCYICALGTFSVGHVFLSFDLSLDPILQHK